VPLPLGQFQHTNALDRADMFKLLVQINGDLRSDGSTPLSESVLEDAFEMQWQRFSDSVQEAMRISPESAIVTRSSEDMLHEVLERLRGSPVFQTWPGSTIFRCT
jgi:hypothetical protein